MARSIGARLTCCGRPWKFVRRGPAFSASGEGCGGGRGGGDGFESALEVGEEASLAVGVAEATDPHAHVLRHQWVGSIPPAVGHDENQLGALVLHRNEGDDEGVGIIGRDDTAEDGEFVHGGGGADAGGDVAEGSGGGGDGRNPLSWWCRTPRKKGQSRCEKG